MRTYHNSVIRNESIYDFVTDTTEMDTINKIIVSKLNKRNKPNIIMTLEFAFYDEAKKFYWALYYQNIKCNLGGVT